MSLYRKTLDKPSAQSVRRAKALEKCAVHPWLAEEGDFSERAPAAVALIASLQSFRPAQVSNLRI